jgi:hypothetical protein
LGMRNTLGSKLQGVHEGGAIPATLCLRRFLADVNLTVS